MKKTLRLLLTLVSPFFLTSCPGPDPIEPEIPTLDVAKGIIGNWLLSSSDANNWITYEFSQSTMIKTEIARQGYLGSGEGFYSITDTKLTGSYTTDRSQTFYLDWYVKDIQTFEIGLEVYNENTYVGKDALYKIVTTLNIDAEQSYLPRYMNLCGTSDVSEFKTLDSTIADVDSRTGEISGIGEGITFVYFNTPKGTAAIKVCVIGKKKSFSELLIGTWVYDSPQDKTWERYTYTQGGYVAVQWITTAGGFDISESKQANYTISGETVSFSLKVDAGQMNMRLETETINDFNWTYNAYNGNSFTGRYTTQRVLESSTLSPQETSTPDYQTLVGNVEIQSYKSHNETVAKVASNGTITAVSMGRTYIDVVTDKGTGVIEVEVDGGAIPVAFQEMIGKAQSKVYEMLGDKPSIETSSIIAYENYSPSIKMVGVSLDSWTGLVNGVTVIYQPTVNTAQVTSILDATFIPFLGPTTDTFKAYMDTAERADASIGVTWDISELTLTYVDLATDLFTNYSILIGLTREEVVSKMGRDADSANDQSQSFFFFDNKGTMIVSAYYTDFTQNFDTVHSVVTMFDDTLSEEEILKYLKRKYPYYPEYSTEEQLVFIPEGHKMEIYYMPKEKMIMYISVTTKSRGQFVDGIISKLRKNTKDLIQ